MAYPNLKYVDTIRQFFVSAARWAWGSVDPWVIELLPRTYDETGAKGAEPHKRWLHLVVHSSRSKWHLKVTFCGTLQAGQNPISSRRPKRRKDLGDLCRCINFQQMRLLDDTVTEGILARDGGAQGARLPCKTRPDTDSEYAAVVSYLGVCIQEDPM
jgi:hypothetical protein